MVVSKRDPRPPYQQIASELRAEIVDGSLAPGTKLPSTRDLQDRFGVGNPTVQRAISILKGEGLVEGLTGRGVFVRERRPWILVSGSYLPVPADGEPDRWTQEAVRQGFRGTQKIVHVAEVELPTEVAAAFEATPGTRAVMRQRVMSVNDQPTELVESYYPLDLATGSAITENRKIRGGARKVLEQAGYPSRESVERISARMPTPDEAIALNLAEGVPVIRTVRTILSDNDRPIEVSIMIMDGDRYQLQFRLPIHEE